MAGSCTLRVSIRGLGAGGGVEGACETCSSCTGDEKHGEEVTHDILFPPWFPLFTLLNGEQPGGKRRKSDAAWTRSPSLPPGKRVRTNVEAAPSILRLPLPPRRRQQQRPTLPSPCQATRPSRGRPPPPPPPLHTPRRWSCWAPPPPPHSLTWTAARPSLDTGGTCRTCGPHTRGTLGGPAPGRAQ